MKPERRSSKGQSSRGARLLVCMGSVLGGVLGCNAYPTLKNLPVDCTADSGYDFLVIDNFESLTEMPFFSAADMTSPAPTVTVEMIPGGPRCNSNGALVIRSVQHNDWGSLFGFSNFGPRNASAYDGVSFWARAPGNTTKSFTILLDDPNSNNLMTATCGAGAAPPAPSPDAGPVDMCKNYCVPDAGPGAPTTTYLDPMTGMAVGGSTSAAPPADACGNDYQAVQVVTGDWAFYTIPFGKFQQGYMPNRVPNPLLTVIGDVPGTGLRTSALTTFTIRLPKEADAELWIDNLGFYRPKKADGGSDAPRM